MQVKILTINGGSSTIKFAVFAGGEQPQRLLTGQVECIGRRSCKLRAREPGIAGEHTREIAAYDHAAAAKELIDWLQQWNAGERFTAIGHRVVHGGVRLQQHQVITEELVEELRRNQPLDLAHLPREISLITTFREHYHDAVQVACFDSAFFSDLPRVARMLPIPRSYWEQGVRRLGFHGLSYTYLVEELRRKAGDTADGRVILAHLGSGASVAAVRGGRPLDTSMAFTPTAGLVMGTRPGDLDPGLLVYMMRVEGKTPEEMDLFVSHECGLAGVSGGSSDVRDLLAMRDQDERAADALSLFCYQVKKWIGAYAAVLGGLDTLVFAGGIGEHAPEVRREICAGLEFLGVELDDQENTLGGPVISARDSRVTVRVIATDEEAVVASIVAGLSTRTEVAREA